MNPTAKTVGQKPLRILLALHQFPPVGAGGTELLVRWTALGLQKLGHEVRVVSAVPRRHGVAMELPIERSDADELDVVFLMPTSGPGDTTSRIVREYDDMEVGDAFGRAVDAAQPDVIHFFHLAGLTAAAMNAATQRRIPFILTITDFWFECPTVQLLLEDGSTCNGPRRDRMNCARHMAVVRWPVVRSLGSMALADRPAAVAIEFLAGLPGVSGVARSLQALQRRSGVLHDAMRGAAAIVAPNEPMHARLLAFGMPASKLHLVPFGVPAPLSETGKNVMPLDGSRPRLLFIGTLAANKGAHLLLQALRIASDLNVDVDIHGQLQGDDYAVELQRFADTDSRVNFRGTFANGKIASVLEAADLLVIPSLWNENSPLVLLQALAQRCPVLVADVPGMAAHVRPTRDGWLFRRGDAHDLARHLRQICEDPAARSAVRAAPYAARTMAPYLADLVRLYEKSMSSHGGPA